MERLTAILPFSCFGGTAFQALPPKSTGTPWHAHLQTNLNWSVRGRPAPWWRRPYFIWKTRGHNCFPSAPLCSPLSEGIPSGNALSPKISRVMTNFEPHEGRVPTPPDPQGKGLDLLCPFLGAPWFWTCPMEDRNQII